MNKGILGVVAIVLVAGSFYGGMVYGKSSASNQSTARRSFQGMNFSGGQGAGGGGGVGARMGGSGNVSGEILSKNATTLTVKMRDGGSRIIIFSSSTPIREFTEVSQSKLEAGKTVTVNGSSNPDGSVTAQVIQIRDASSTPFGPGFNRPPQQ